MLTDNEKKLVQTYARLAANIKPSYIGAIAVVLVWGLLYCVTDIAGQAYSVFGWWLGFALTEVAVLLGWFTYCTVRTRFGYKKDKWKNIAEKVGAEVNDGGIISKYVSATVIQPVNSPGHIAAASASVNVLGDLLYKNAAVVAEAADIEIVKPKPVMKRLLLIAVALIVAFSIPMIVKASADLREMKGVVASSVQKIYDTCKAEDLYVNDPSFYFGAWDYTGDRGVTIDPKEIHYRSNTVYSVTCRTDEDYSTGSYIEIGLDNSGTVKQVSYVCRLAPDSGMTGEEIYAQLEKDFTALHGALLKTDLPFASGDLRDAYLPTEEFRRRFLEADLSGEGASFFINDGSVSEHLTWSLEKYVVSVRVTAPKKSH